MEIDWGIPLISGKVHEDYLRMAYQYAWKNSADGRTKTGAVITSLDREKVLGIGANRFPPGLEYTAAQLEDTFWKRENIIHSEDSAVRDMICKSGVFALDQKKVMYMPWIPCIPCARIVERTGFEFYIGHKQMIDRTPADWVEGVKEGSKIMQRAGIQVLMIDGKIGGVEAIMRGDYWQP